MRKIATGVDGFDTHQQLRDLLSQMTLEEKIGQMSQCNTLLLADTAFDPTGPATKRNLSAEQIAMIGSSLNFACAADAISAFIGRTPIKVLPYHNHAGSKYAALGMENTLPTRIPSQQEILAAEDKMSHPCR